MIQRVVVALLLWCAVLGAKAEEPLAVFGLWADVQYADRDQTPERDYRGAKTKLSQAIEWLNTQRVPLTVSLGDWVDRNLSSYDSLAPVLACADSVVYPVLGNHEAYEFRKDSIAVVEKLHAIGFAESYYYTIDQGAVRLLVLNTNRGAMTNRQLAWVEQQLQEAQCQGKIVIILSHHPLYYDYVQAARAERGVELCALLERYKNTVKACFAGHFHYGGYHCVAGIHHYVMPGMVQKQSNELCLKITIFGDRMTLVGPKGTKQTLKFNNLSK